MAEPWFEVGTRYLVEGLPSTLQHVMHDGRCFCSSG